MIRTVFRGYNRIKFQSLKIGETVFCQSLLLRDYLIQLEWDDSVIYYQLKPFKISLKVDGNRKTISPHLLVDNVNNRQTLTWLKSQDHRVESHSQIIKLITSFCENKGLNFVVKSPEEIRKEPLFSNLKFLRRYLRVELSLRQILLCKEFFRHTKSAELNDLVKFYISKNEQPLIAYALLSQKLIESDIATFPVNADLTVKPANRLPISEKGRLVA